jgi:hypothetical protein
MNQTVKQRIPSSIMAFANTKKVEIWSFLGPGSGSGSDQKGPDPTDSVSPTLTERMITL